MRLKNKAFTLVEIMLALAIFAVLMGAIYQISSFFSKKTTTSAKKSHQSQDLILFYAKLNKELKLVKQFDWPPLKVDSEWMSYFFNNDSIALKKVADKLIRTDGFNEKIILTGLKEVKFTRPDRQLLELELSFDDDTYSSKIFLEGLK